MKKLYFFSLFLVSSFIFSQNNYWTSYNFSVDGKDAETIVSLMDSYFKDNLPEGVSVILYENHFRDTRNQYTHQLIWSGPLKDLSDTYKSLNMSQQWQLMASRLSPHIESFHSASAGTNEISSSVQGAKISDYPFQRLIELEVENQSKFFADMNEYQKKYNPTDRFFASGRINMGNNDDDGNVWMLLCYKNLRDAFGGPSKMKGKYSESERRKGWQAYRKNSVETDFRVSTMRIMLKSWGI